MVPGADARRELRDSAVFARLLRELELDGGRFTAVRAPGASVPLPSALPVGEFAWLSVLATGAALSPADVRAPDPAGVAAAYRSDRHLLIDGTAPDVWSPLSRFWPASDGWVRTHGNYPHHAAALRAGLGLDHAADAEAVAARLRELPADRATADIRDAGGVCTTVKRERPERDEDLCRHPLVEISRLDDAPRRPLPAASEDAPLAGVRVLDLTRVIAGPVATRTLAFAGADVLRIDPPRLAEPIWQHLDTGHGKRSALLDVAEESERIAQLLAGADVVVLGYRPAALSRLGLSPARLAHEHPHLVIAQLSAWPGPDSPRGFDSIVQADCGISWIESADGRAPGALPAQALDHTAGYLLAAGIATALRQRAEAGGARRVRLSLRRVAAELLRMPRHASSPQSRSDGEIRTQAFDVAGRRVITVAPAVRWAGSPMTFTAPRPWGQDAAEW
ncbi:CoA transferase [Microbacterium sp. NPDC058345]|uniref:CoA transferase n=1 Tax=Microbacterium sp. NPDC058345 TaxID=3346455 RepID=UPI003654B5CD